MSFLSTSMLLLMAVVIAWSFIEISRFIYLYFSVKENTPKDFSSVERVADTINKAVNNERLNSKERLYLIIVLLEEFALQEDNVRTTSIKQLIELQNRNDQLNLGEQLWILADELKALIELHYKPND